MCFDLDSKNYLFIFLNLFQFYLFHLSKVTFRVTIKDISWEHGILKIKSEFTAKKLTAEILG